MFFCYCNFRYCIFVTCVKYQRGATESVRSGGVRNSTMGREVVLTEALKIKQAQCGKSVFFPVKFFPLVVPSKCPFLSMCRHFSEFLRSHHFCKYQIEVLTSGTVYLADILFCESALFYFSEVKSAFPLILC